MYSPYVCYQRWSRGHKARGQGQGHKKISRPRTELLEAKAKDQGHRRKCSPKKTRSSKILSGDLKQKVFKSFFSGEKGLKIFFSGILHVRKTKKGLRKFSARFLAFFNKILTVQDIVLFSSRGQGNFRGHEASRPRTSKCVLEDVFEAKDVLEDSTSVCYTSLTSQLLTYFCQSTLSSSLWDVVDCKTFSLGS